MQRAGFESPSWATPQLSLCGFASRGVVAPRTVQCLMQMHGAKTHRVGWGNEGAWPDSPGEGDALWTRSAGLPVSVRVADCVPILLWSPDPAAVAAVHAGWRGTAANIVGEALRLGSQEFGVRAASVYAAIGPCISRDRFEVGPEVVQALLAAGVPPDALRTTLGPGGKPHVDLRSANRALLRQAGVPDAHIEDVGGCTFSDPRYDSYRRDGAASERMSAVIALAPVTTSPTGASR